MKKLLSIAFLSTALLLLTVLPFLPHHHHRDVVCTVMELCEADRTYNDRHTAHDTADEQSGEEGCVAHASFAPANMQSGVTMPDTQLLQAVGQVVFIAVPEIVAINLPTEYGLFIAAYKPASPNPGGGLRAPPRLS